jgi:hypothetical protein
VAKEPTVIVGTEKKLPNLLVLRSFRLRGEHIEAGSVIPKSAFVAADGTEDKGTWSELCSQMPQTCTQTDMAEHIEPTARELRAAAAQTDRNAKSGATRMPGA